MSETKPEIGWGNPSPFTRASRFHYFTGGRSLCGKWMRFNGSFELEDANDDHKDNCAGCKKKIEQHRAAITKAKGENHD